MFFLFRSQTLFSNSMKDLQVTVNASLLYFEVKVDLELEQNRNYVIYSLLLQGTFENKRAKQINMCFYLANFVMPVIFVIFALSYFAIH